MKMAGPRKQMTTGAKPMESNDNNRRNAERYQINTPVIIRRVCGDSVSALAIDISSSGMLVRLDPPIPFELGESVTVEVELAQHTDKPFSPWGIGRVVRVDTETCAVQ